MCAPHRCIVVRVLTRPLLLLHQLLVGAEEALRADIFAAGAGEGLLMAAIGFDLLLEKSVSFLRILLLLLTSELDVTSWDHRDRYGCVDHILTRLSRSCNRLLLQLVWMASVALLMECLPRVGLLRCELRVPGSDYGELSFAHLDARMVPICSCS